MLTTFFLMIWPIGGMVRCSTYFQYAATALYLRSVMFGTTDDNALSCFLSPSMTVTKKHEPADVRINNRMMVFGQIFSSCPMSRAQIGRKTGLSRVAACEVVSDMLDKHFLMENGYEQPTRPGKKGTLVSVDDQYWNVVVLDLSMPFLLQAAVMNLRGEIVTRVEKSFDKITAITPETVIALAESLLDGASHILGFGVAVPGIVDEDGVVVETANFGWKNVPLRKMFQQHFGKFCTVDNDANSALIGERFCGAGRATGIFVQIAVGVGAALLIDDSLVLGSHHAAGEIGHVVVDPDGPQCTCGKRGCLETFISAANLRRRINENPLDRTTMLQEAGRSLGHVLAPSVSLLDLDDVFVYGSKDIVDDIFLGATECAINAEAASTLQNHSIRVQQCSCGDDIVLRGESIAVVQAVLRNANEYKKVPPVGFELIGIKPF